MVNQVIRKMLAIGNLEHLNESLMLNTYRHLETSLFWSGGCKRQINLEPDSTKTFSVFANFCWPGVYNLNTLKISVARENGSQYYLQRWQRTSYITIE